jgi:hypothetical protein
MDALEGLSAAKSLSHRACNCTRLTAYWRGKAKLGMAHNVSLIQVLVDVMDGNGRL